MAETSVARLKELRPQLKKSERDLKSNGARIEQLQYENDNLVNAALKAAEEKAELENSIRFLKAESAAGKQDRKKSNMVVKKLEERCEAWEEKHKAQGSALEAMSYTLMQARNKTDAIERASKEHKDVVNEQ